MSQIDKLKLFTKDFLGTDLGVWREVLIEKFGIKIGNNRGILMDYVYSMLFGIPSPRNEIGRDFYSFENKTLKCLINRNGLRAKGDIRISKILYDTARDNSFEHSIFNDKSKNTIFNLHIDDIVIDVRQTNTTIEVLEDEYEKLMKNIKNKKFMTDPKARKTKKGLIGIKYYKSNAGADSVFAWKGGKMDLVSESVVEDGVVNEIKNQKEYILSLIEKYEMKYVKPLWSTRFKDERMHIDQMRQLLMNNSGKTLDVFVIADILEQLTESGAIKK